MKQKLFNYLTIATTMVIIAMPHATRANFAAGGELTYQYVADSTYRFIFKLYRDCSGSAAPDSVPVCFVNQCNSTFISIKMGKWGTPKNIGPGCTQYKTTCDSPASTLPGYKEQLYSAEYTLPSRCSTWKIFTYVANRNNSINLQNATSNPLYLEVIFNNTVSDTNSSPHYSGTLPYVAQNMVVSLPGYITDPDGDSLSTQVVLPLTGVSTCSDTAIVLPFVVTTPPLKIPLNPIQTGNTFTMNLFNGHMSFVSTGAGQSNVAIRTNEYRNGMLIGSTMREMPVVTMPLISPPASISGTLGCGLSGPTGPTINGCANQNLSFCFNIQSSDTNQILKLSDDLATAIPGATITYTHQGSDSVHGVFNWTPGINEAGPFRTQIVIRDSTCLPPGLLVDRVLDLHFYIWGRTRAGNDTAICPNSSIQLKATGGSNYNWTILPGGSAGSLSNPNIANPIATPAVTTSYVVTANTNPLCPGINKDTIQVTVLPTSSITYPVINISVLPDSNVTFGDTVVFTANATGCTNPRYQWKINGTTVSGETQNTFTTSTLFDQQKVSCILSCDDRCPSPKDTFSNGITMHIASSVNDVHNTAKNLLYPNPNSGQFVVDLSKIAGEGAVDIRVVDMYGQSVFHRQTWLASEQIELPEAVAGIYLLKATYGVNSITVRFTIR